MVQDHSVLTSPEYRALQIEAGASVWAMLCVLHNSGLQSSLWYEGCECLHPVEGELAKSLWMAAATWCRRHDVGAQDDAIKPKPRAVARTGLGNQIRWQHSGIHLIKFPRPNCKPPRNFPEKELRMNKPIDQLELVPAEPVKAPVKLPALAPDNREFDWNDDNSIILRRQPETAVYWNQNNDLVIRQRNWPDDDPFIVIAANNLHEIIDRLCDMAGIPGVGRRT